MPLPDNRFDVVIVGQGVFGAASAWRLAARGVSVLGLDQFEIPNALGSSHGRTRIFRSLSHNHPLLYSLAARSRRLWLDLEREAGDSLFQQTGYVAVGKMGAGVIGGATAIIRANRLEPELVQGADIARRFPAFGNISEDDVAVIDPEGGILYPERCVSALTSAAQHLGATLRSNVRVSGHSADGADIVVHTDAGDVRTGSVVYATGSWSAKFFPHLTMTPLRIPQCWFHSVDSTTSSPPLSDLPAFHRDLDEVHGLWGHGAVSGQRFTKLGTSGHPFHDRTVDPDAVDRDVHSVDFEYLSDLVPRSFPTLDPTPAEATICLLMQSADNQFLLGPVGDPRVIVASGESGQGFKHATGVGDIVADYCLGADSPLDRAFMSAGRFGS